MDARIADLADRLVKLEDLLMESNKHVHVPADDKNDSSHAESSVPNAVPSEPDDKSVSVCLYVNVSICMYFPRALVLTLFVYVNICIDVYFPFAVLLEPDDESVSICMYLCAHRCVNVCMYI